MPDQIAPQVTAFITAHVRSVEALQVLMLLLQTPDRWWDAAAVWRETGLTASVAGRMLHQLAASNLLDIKVTGDVRYRFAPGTPDLHAAAMACSELYYRTPWRLLSALPGVSRRSVADFADAFRIRRDDDR